MDAVVVTLQGLHDSLFTRVQERLLARWPSLRVEGAQSRETEYYPEFSFKVAVTDGKDHFEIGDGGLVPWTATLIANAKERLCISGIGTERICQVWAPTS